MTFRAKAVQYNSWVYGIPYLGRDKFYIMVKRNKFIEVRPGTIGQFTGAYDKVDKPIYEGDILMSMKTSELYVVEESTKFCSFVAKNMDNPLKTKNLTKDNATYAKNRLVVGDVYDGDTSSAKC